MAESTATSDIAHSDSSHEHGDHAHHPTERQYWIVFVLLAILTAVEVAWSYIPGLEGPSLVLPLLAMMVVKFLLVAGAFMHLYFDMKIVNGRLFTWAFGFSFLVAVIVYLVMFMAFDLLPI